MTLRVQATALLALFLSLRGLSLRGLSLRGLSLRGLSLRGLSLRGLSLRGLSFVCLSLGCGGADTVAPTVTPVTIEPSRPQGDPPPALPVRTLEGTWAGIGTQTIGLSWNMELEVTVAAPGRCAVVAYPPDCGGHWICEEPSDRGELVGVEHITWGSGCVLRVPFRFVLGADDRATFHGDAGEGDKATAVLSRRDVPAIRARKNAEPQPP